MHSLGAISNTQKAFTPLVQLNRIESEFSLTSSIWLVDVLNR